MGASVTFRSPDFPRFDAIVGQLQRRGEDLSPLMDIIGQALESSTIERFDEERAPDGSRWTPSLRARLEGGKTLTKSARLKQSITHRSTSDSAEVGTNLIYAGTHQEGATIRGKGGKLSFRLPGGLGFRSVEQVIIPARPFLGVSADDELEIIAQGEDYLAEALR